MICQTCTACYIVILIFFGYLASNHSLAGKAGNFFSLRAVNFLSFHKRDTPRYGVPLEAHRLFLDALNVCF